MRDWYLSFLSREEIMRVIQLTCESPRVRLNVRHLCVCIYEWMMIFFSQINVYFQFLSDKRQTDRQKHKETEKQTDRQRKKIKPHNKKKLSSHKPTNNHNETTESIPPVSYNTNPSTAQSTRYKSFTKVQDINKTTRESSLVPRREAILESKNHTRNGHLINHRTRNSYLITGKMLQTRIHLKTDRFYEHSPCLWSQVTCFHGIVKRIWK